MPAPVPSLLTREPQPESLADLAAMVAGLPVVDSVQANTAGASTSDPSSPVQTLTEVLMDTARG
jgi:hypothetical protein